MGFSIAFFIMMLDMVDMTIQMNTNLIQTFLADITRGIIHIPTNVQICNFKIRRSTKSA